ncbi:unnamed protein product [Darwinula stevensoni]|uniref:Uncharacterized protein n=1 Tax=Darwinula stevensoni TaxID=69355 RepID=A0A7R9AAF1_9CRUS|nr:unnamed protein product [Darwinula stevensoni]CAG0898099.1 unnamed protein product [Darwinula stevensoni]
MSQLNVSQQGRSDSYKYLCGRHDEAFQISQASSERQSMMILSTALLLVLCQHAFLALAGPAGNEKAPESRDIYDTIEQGLEFIGEGIGEGIVDGVGEAIGQALQGRRTQNKKELKGNQALEIGRHMARQHWKDSRKVLLNVSQQGRSDSCKYLCGRHDEAFQINRAYSKRQSMMILSTALLLVLCQHAFLALAGPAGNEEAPESRDIYGKIEQGLEFIGEGIGVGIVDGGGEAIGQALQGR